MAAIADSFKKVVDFVMDGFRGENPFDDINDEDYDDNDYDYIEDGNALREPAPSFTPVPMMEKRQESKIINHPSINRGGNEIIVVDNGSNDSNFTIWHFFN